MPDDSQPQRPRDVNRINIHEHAEVGHWCKKIGCTRAQLVVAVHTVGPNVQAVSAYLREVAPRRVFETIPIRGLRPDAMPLPPARRPTGPDLSSPAL